MVYRVGSNGGESHGYLLITSFPMYFNVHNGNLHHQVRPNARSSLNRKIITVFISFLYFLVHLIRHYRCRI